MKKIASLVLIILLQGSINLYSLTQEEIKKVFGDLFSRDFKKREIAINLVRENHPPELMPLLKDRILESDDAEEAKDAISILREYNNFNSAPEWVDILQRSKSPELKITVIEHLARMNDRRAIPAIAQELKNEHSAVRETAGKTLETLRDDRIYPVILEMADSSNPVMKVYALEAMFHVYDNRLYQSIAEMLKDQNKSIRIYVLKCMLKNQILQALPLIRNTAYTDTNEEVKITAIEILGEFTDYASAYILHKALADKSRDVRLAAAKSLNRVISYNSIYPLSAQLSVESDDQIIDAILESLIKLKRGGNLTGLQRILNGLYREQLRIKAAYTLGVIYDDKAVQILIEALPDENFRLRAEICNSLGNYRLNKNSFAALLEVLQNDTSRYVKLAALYSLRRMNDRKTVINLLDIYQTETDIIFKYVLYQTIRDLLSRYL